MQYVDRQTGRQTDRHANRQTGYNYLIDCFRILAVLMVLTVHVRGYLQGVPSVIDNLFALGAYGVALYFVISGFLSYSSVQKSRSFVEYWKRKSARILPMYYFSLLLTFVVGGLILKEYPITWQWIYHVFFLNMFIPAKEWMWWNSVNYFWTMPAFVAWYALSYPLFRTVNNSKKAVLFLLAATIAVPLLKSGMRLFASDQFVNWNFFCLLYVFFFGTLAYFVIEEKKFIKGMLYGIGIAVVGVLIGNRSGFFVFGLLFYYLIVLSNMMPIRKPNERVTLIIHSMSAVTYSTYLTHWFIIKFLGKMLGKLPWIIAFILFLVMAGTLGFVCYRLIEKPCSRFLLSLKCKT